MSFGLRDFSLTGRARKSDSAMLGWWEIGRVLAVEHIIVQVDFGRGILAWIMLAVFAGEFEVEVLNVEGARAFDPVWYESAFGTARPRGKIAARIKEKVV